MSRQIGKCRFSIVASRSFVVCDLRICLFHFRVAVRSWCRVIQSHHFVDRAQFIFRHNKSTREKRQQSFSSFQLSNRIKPFKSCSVQVDDNDKKSNCLGSSCPILFLAQNRNVRQSGKTVKVRQLFAFEAFREKMVRRRLIRFFFACFFLKSNLAQPKHSDKRAQTARSILFVF
jgi:hypothetical protein